MAVGALNYLYYPVLGRMLNTSAFGEVQTLVSLFLQLSVFLMVLSMVIVNIVANYADEARRNKFIFEFEKLALLTGAILLVASLAFSRQLQVWLNFENSWPFALLGLAVLVSVPFILRGAYLRGHQKFGLVAAGNIVAAGGKLVLSVVLVLLGLGTIGAMGGVVLAQIVACGIVVWWAARLGLKGRGGTKKISAPDFKLLAPELRYGGVVLAASLAITLQYSMDIIVIKHYFDADTAGIYAGIAAVARILFFLTASIAQVLISKVKIRSPDAQNQKLLNKSLILLTVISLPVLLCTVFLPSQTVHLLMGKTYVQFAGLLPMLSVSVFIASALNLLAAYYLSLRRFGIATLAVVGAGFTYLFILLHHGSPAEVVESLFLGSAVTLFSVGVWNITERRYGVWTRS